MPEDVLAQLLRRVADLERRLAAVVRPGRVAAVQDRPYRVQVDVGAAGASVLTGLLHVLVPRSGPSMVDFSPLEVGEGVLVLAPGGGDAMFVLPSLAAGRIELVAGDADARAMSGRLLVGMGIEVADGGVTVSEGDVAVSDGDVTLSGDLTASGVSDGAGSLGNFRTTYNSHTHPATGGPTGPPTQRA